MASVVLRHRMATSSPSGCPSGEGQHGPPGLLVGGGGPARAEAGPPVDARVPGEEFRRPVRRRRGGPGSRRPGRARRPAGRRRRGRAPAGPAADQVGQRVGRIAGRCGPRYRGSSPPRHPTGCHRCGRYDPSHGDRGRPPTMPRAATGADPRDPPLAAGPPAGVPRHHRRTRRSTRSSRVSTRWSGPGPPGRRNLRPVRRLRISHRRRPSGRRSDGRSMCPACGTNAGAAH